MRTRVALAVLLSVGVAAEGAIIWDGPDVTFSKPAFANVALPQNQDRLTDQVWITRASTRGLYNIRQEAAYVNDLSPRGTEWAYGSAADWAALTFRPWEIWAGGQPPTIVGKPAVLHLVAEDIYLDIRFLSWAQGSSGGGAFSYVRSSPPIPEPSGLMLAGLGAVALLRRRRR